MEVPLSTARRVVSKIAGVLLLAVAGAALAVRYTPIRRHRVLVTVVMSPFLMPAAPLALVVSLWGRRWALAGMAGCLTAVLVAIQLPRYLSADPDPNAVPVRMMTINMRFGNADPRDLARIADENADIVTVQELTPDSGTGSRRGGDGRHVPLPVARRGRAGAGGGRVQQVSDHRLHPHRRLRVGDGQRPRPG